MKKVALIGNAANNFFSAARYLRDHGYDARLFLFSEEYRDWPHFLPENDTFSDNFNQFVETSFFSKYPSSFIHASEEDIKKFFAQFDYIIGSSTIPAYASKSGLKLDLFVPYGSDLYYLPFFHLHNGIRKTIIGNLLSLNQKKGIQNARFVWFDDTNAINEKKLASLKIKGFRIRQNFPLIYLPEYSIEQVAKHCHLSQQYQFLNQRKKEFDFLIFHHCRHEWFSYSKDLLSYKGNDKIVLALKRLLEKNHKVKPLVAFLEYGSDVLYTKKLIQDLALEDYIIWLPKMSRKELMLCLSIADLGIGELGHSWFSYSVVYEFLASGVPVIHHRNENLYLNKILYPMINAKTVDDVVEALMQYIANPKHFAEIGAAGKQWIIQHGIKQPLRTLINIIEGYNQ